MNKSAFTTLAGIWAAAVFVGCVSDDALIVQMRQSVAEGKAAVIAKDGVIVAELEGRGVKPILDVLDKNPAILKGAIVVDKVVGRAAAAIYVVGKTQKVVALVMSQGAVDLLRKNGVSAVADKTVPFIVNREKAGMCPMDAATLNLSDPGDIVGELRRQQKQMRQ